MRRDCARSRRSSRNLLSDDHRKASDELLSSADRIAALLLAQYERNELKGLDEDLSRRARARQ